MALGRTIALDVTHKNKRVLRAKGNVIGKSSA